MQKCSLTARWGVLAWAVEIDEQLVLQAGYRHADLAIPDGQRQLFVPGDALIQFLQRDLAWSGLIIG